MLGFWIIAAAAAFATMAILGRALLSGGGHAPDDTAAFDMQVYRDQLTELDRDVARGVIDAAEAERARLETSRRLLEADRKARAGTAARSAPKGLTRAALALLAVVLLGGSFGLYARLGAILPGPKPAGLALPEVMPDLPLAERKANADSARAARPGQAAMEAELPHWAGPPPEASAEYLETIDRLRAAMADRPDDLKGQKLLTQHEAALGNFAAAHQAMARVIAIKGEDAGVDDYTQYADLLVLAAHGGVSPEAEAAIRQALEIDPADGIARYYLGLMYAQNDRPDLAFPIWRDLLERSPADTPWTEPIRGQIGQLAAMAGVDYTPPGPRPAHVRSRSSSGPSPEDIEAAKDMTEAEQRAMVAEMVGRLMQRLATEGGTPQEWAQLIAALTVQGDTDRARVVWGEAQSVFAAHPEAVATVDRAAAEAGLSAPIPYDGHGAEAPAPGAAGETGTASPDTPPEMVPEMAPEMAPDSPPETPPGIPPMAGPVANPGVLPEAEPELWPELTPETLAENLTKVTAGVSGDDRMAMLDGLATKLADELATFGGPPEQWAMLLGALVELDADLNARLIWKDAQKAFADDPESLAALARIVEALGVTE